MRQNVQVQIVGDMVNHPMQNPNLYKSCVTELIGLDPVPATKRVSTYAAFPAQFISDGDAVDEVHYEQEYSIRIEPDEASFIQAH